VRVCVCHGRRSGTHGCVNGCRDVQGVPPVCLCMYVCLYVCGMYVCLYVCGMYVRLPMCLCMYVCVYVCGMYVCLKVCMFMCMCVSLCVCVCVCHGLRNGTPSCAYGCRD